MNYKHLTDKLDKAEDPYKILWGWIKQGTIDLKTFKYLIQYLVKHENI